MDPTVFARAFARPPALLTPTRGFAAVAAVFTPTLDLVLIRRAEHPSDPWSGHVSFPGGRVEASDPDPLAAAIRETAEEIGLDLTEGAPVGQLDDLAAVGGRPGLVIRPFVFVAPVEPAALTPNREVAGIHTIGLDRLLAGDGRTTMTWTRDGGSMVLPCVEFDGQRLWGLTLRMIDDLLDRIDGGGIGLRRAARPEGPSAG
ncbi:MAG: CoA pyrophosphatase [Myxococcota bacterium]